MGLWDAIRFWDDKRERRTEVRVRVHRALIHGGVECYFVNVLNASPERDVTVTHTWFETDPRVDFVNPQRPLPRRIAPRDQWETWIEVDRVPSQPPAVWQQARVQLADDTVIASVQRSNVPPAGMIPGA